MRARLVVFPVKGRNWCFSRSVDPALSETASNHTPSTVKDLWRKISSSKFSANNAELFIDFVSNKVVFYSPFGFISCVDHAFTMCLSVLIKHMNRAWMGMEMAPEGTMKKKIHGLGLKLLARVKPSEIFLKSITKEVSGVEITYPSSLNPRLVRRRLRHIATRGAAIHKKHLYGSVILLPLTSTFMVLPRPTFLSFGSYFALILVGEPSSPVQGSEKLLEIVSNTAKAGNSDDQNMKENKAESAISESKDQKSQNLPLVFHPSKELKEYLQRLNEDDDGKCVISKICKAYKLNANDVLKYRHTM